MAIVCKLCNNDLYSLRGMLKAKRLFHSPFSTRKSMQNGHRLKHRRSRKHIVDEIDFALATNDVNHSNRSQFGE